MKRVLEAKTILRAMRIQRMVAVRSAMARTMMRHESVMVGEVMGALNLRPGSVAVDGTLGLGGHAAQMLKAVAPGGAVIGLDWDASMLAEARARLGEPAGVRLHLVHASFEQISSVLGELGLKADGILLDLGLNSAQVDDAARGLSFHGLGPLDMRMDVTRGEPASALLNRAAPGEIERVLSEFGDERWARAIAKAVVERRRGASLKTTQDLVDCVLAAIPPRAREKRIHPATRTFQAVRIWVNGELDLLEGALRGAARSLAPNGVLVVLSYHSGEDRIVKQTFRSLAADEGFEDLSRKPLVPTPEEVRANPRARSAKMRVLRQPRPLGAAKTQGRES
ncbi:MAG: 16S rRNA (cytosine(1402)-N(4))-methyltransferase RsmH [Fimbriimonadaceae bacterium]|nr:16S rRNA (cytosine(1402)-N(4))-methyltransferase RsmH [Chthonomonadaceae bacterium]MCO5297598.1 16S rRNA (cytosine(1402)-N(4))-methyltransferase RsmH [Fimbriimonadaceae bacterium]